MGLIGNVSSRKEIQDLELNSEGQINLNRYGKNDRHFASVEVVRNVEEIPKTIKGPLKERAFKHAGDLLVFVIPDLINYEIDKIMSDEMWARKPVGKSVQGMPEKLKPLSKRATSTSVAGETADNEAAGQPSRVGFGGRLAQQLAQRVAPLRELLKDVPSSTNSLGFAK